MYDEPDVDKGKRVEPGQVLFMTVSKNVNHLDLQAYFFNELLLSRSTVKDAEVTLDILDDDYGQLEKIACDLADVIRAKWPNHPLVKRLDMFIDDTNNIDGNGDNDETVAVG